MAKSLQIRRKMAKSARNLAYKLMNNPETVFDTGREFDVKVLRTDMHGFVTKEKITGPACALGQIKWSAGYLKDGGDVLPYVRRESSRQELLEAADMIIEANDEYKNLNVTQAEALVFPLLHFADVIDVK